MGASSWGHGWSPGLWGHRSTPCPRWMSRPMSFKSDGTKHRPFQASILWNGFERCFFTPQPWQRVGEPKQSRQRIWDSRTRQDVHVISWGGLPYPKARKGTAFDEGSNHSLYHAVSFSQVRPAATKMYRILTFPFRDLTLFGGLLSSNMVGSWRDWGDWGSWMGEWARREEEAFLIGLASLMTGTACIFFPSLLLLTTTNSTSVACSWRPLLLLFRGWTLLLIAGKEETRQNGTFSHVMGVLF